MANREYNRECMVICEKCGTVNKAAWVRTVFAWNGKWKMHHCLKCNNKIHLERKMETIVCPFCGTVSEKNEKNECLSCHRIIYRENDYFKAECRNCGVTNLIPRDKAEGWKCSICDKPFDKDQLTAPVPQVAEPINIKLKTQQQMIAEDLIIWKHPMNEFSYRSRLQVSEGTWALLLQDGVCQYPYGPGSYLLEESKLTTAQKLAKDDPEGLVYNTDIFCVLKTLPNALFGANVKSLQNEDKTKDYVCKATGNLTWNVTDAKAFAEKIGYRETKGKAELFLNTPDVNGEDGMMLHETRKLVEDALEVCLKNIIGLESIDPEKLIYKKADIEKQLQAELDRRADVYGLSVGALKLMTLDVSLNTQSSVTADTKRMETIHLAAQKEYQWKTERPARVYVTNSDTLYADYTLSGTARCRISDNDRFEDLQEIRTMADDSKAAESYFNSIISEIVTSVAAQAAQDLIDQQDMGIRELVRRKNDLANSIIAQANGKLISYGIQIDPFNILEISYVESPELKKQGERANREKKFKAYAEKTITWRTDMIRVNKKDEPTLYADVSLSGTCRLEVADDRSFYANSDVNEFIEKDPFTNDQAVNDYYKKKVEDCIKSTLLGYTQKMIDRYDSEIIALERNNKELEAEVKNDLDRLVRKWGMGVESVFLTNTDVRPSAALKRAEETQMNKTNARLDKEDKKTSDDMKVFNAQTDAATTNAVDDAYTDTYTHARTNQGKRAEADTEFTVGNYTRADSIDAIKHENQMKAQERATKEKVGAIEGQGTIDDAADRNVLNRMEHSFDADRRILNHEQQIARSREEQKRIIAQIQHEANLDDVKFKETLVSILHRIDASNLDWQKKLDEYARLSRNLGFEDWVNEQRTIADTSAYKTRTIETARIENERDKGKMELGLRKEEEDLVETINRNAEERYERMTQAEYERNERETILDFQQTIEMEKLSFDQDMAKLKEEHAENQRIREQEDRIAELQSKLWMTELNLDAQVRQMELVTNADIARTNAEKAAKIAEAEYKTKHEAQERAEADRREREAQQRQDSFDKRAEDLLKRVMEMQEVIEQAKLGFQIHLDDNARKLGETRATSGADQLLQKIQELTESVKDTKQNEISQKLDRLGDVIAYGRHGDRSSDDMKEIGKKIGKINDSLEETKKELERIRGTVKKVAQNRCPKCGAPTGKGDRFCVSCGALLAGTAGNMIPCNSCGKMIPAGSAVCPHCSNPV